jgi:glycerate 2-kinase
MPRLSAPLYYLNKMIITNFKNLARNPLRKKALLIAEAGYQEIDIAKTVKQRINLKNGRLTVSGTITRDSAGKHHLDINLNNYKNVFVVGIGKGSALASLALAKILGKGLSAGIALDVQKPKLEIRNSKLKILTGTHPLPSKKNVRATQKIIKLTKNLKKDDLLITFICGGGSALLCGSGKELKYSQTIFRKLTKAGADIFELNTVRKHLSEIKGGGFAKLAYPATAISLIVSDVPGNNLSMVASGPTVFDKTTKKQAENILNKYLRKSAYKSELIRVLAETPKDKKYFKKVKNVLFLSNYGPVLAMAKKAKQLSFKPKIHSLKIHGEAKKSLLPLMEAKKKDKAILAAGETTVKLSQKSGKGGRNMEAVLAVLTRLMTKDKRLMINLALLSFASDGRDNTEAAGAIVDISTIKKAARLKLNPQEYLQGHDSFNFFKKTGDLIFVQKKSFNVSDLMILLKQ